MNILDEIVAYKREFIAAARGTTSLDEVRAKAESAPPTRGFAKRLRGTRGNDGKRVAQETLRVVAEIKRASPSRGVIREDFNPAGLAASYDAGGASALSVLTDEKFFQGSLDCLIQARQASDLPILRKEFIIDVYQIHEARGAGADCILLIAGILPWGELNALRAEARSVGLEVLLEIHERSEVEPGLGLSPDVLGINNRDLRSADFKTDLSRTEELIDYIPDEVTLMSESGIRDREDVERLARLGVDAILVGEHLMREPDPGEAIGRKLGLGPGGGEEEEAQQRPPRDIEERRNPSIQVHPQDEENVAQPPSAVTPRSRHA